MEHTSKEEISRALLEYLPQISKHINKVIENIQYVVDNYEEGVSFDLNKFAKETLYDTSAVIEIIEKLHTIIPLDRAKKSDDIIYQKYHESLNSTLSGVKELLSWFTDKIREGSESIIEANDLLDAIDKMYTGADIMFDLVSIITDDN
jgi:hypothetical protein